MRKILLIAVLLVFAGISSYSQGTRYWYRNAGPVAGPVHAIAVSPNDEIFAATGNSIYRSADAGSNWSNLSSGLNGTDIYSLGFDNSGNVWAGGIGQVYRSDGGANWVSLTSTLNDYIVSSIVFDDRGAIYIGTMGNFQAGDGGIYRSLDGGITWTNMNGGLGNLQITKLAIVDSVMYAGTLAGLYRSVDSAQTWQLAYAPGTGEVTGIGMSPTNHQVYASFRNQGIFKFDQNEGWNRIGGSQLPYQTINGFFIDSEGRIYAAMDGEGLMRTTDMGENWGNYSEGFDTGTNVTAFGRTNAGAYFVGTQDGLYSSINNLSATELQPYEKIFVSPNPFSSQAVVTYNFDRPTTVQMRLYNSFGERVSSFEENLSTAPGVREFYIDAAGLPAGVYILNIIENGTLAHAEKLLIRK